MRAISEGIAFVILLAPFVCAAAIVAAVLLLTGLGATWPWQYWLMLSPLLYVIWLGLYLLLSGLLCRLLGARYPKPRYATTGVSGTGAARGDLGLLTAMVCYRRMGLVETLPLAWALARLEWIAPFFLRAYAPSVHMGRRVTNFGHLYDPDLTHIGDDAIIGARAIISAHSMAARRGGGIVFVSAPVTIGRGATIGGDSRVELGSTIGEDAIVEPGSVLAPFTRIPPREVWGGSPASLRRYRDAQDGPSPDNHVSVLTTPSTILPREIRSLVLNALNLVDEAGGDIPAELSRDTLAGWDSLGQIAIAAALFDRYGITVNANELFSLSSLPEVADFVARRLGMAAADAVPGLPRDLELLPLLDDQLATQQLARNASAPPLAGLRTLRVVIAATFTIQPLEATLKLWARAYGFQLDCQFVDYGQVMQVLLDDNGPFAANAHGVNVVLARLEDLVTGSSREEPFEQLLEALSHHCLRRTGQGQMLVGTLPPIASPFTHANPKLVDTLRHHWRTHLDALTGVDVFDFAGVLERLGIDASRSSRGEVLARAPYSPRLYQALGISLVRAIRSTRRSPAKVIAVDCDNTLWGGVVGEVGPEAIELGSDGRGRAFQLFQHQLKQLQASGLLLAVVSRNEEQDVRQIFESHPEMVLRSSDIAAWRVNWNPKSQNLQEVAAELNLGLDAFVFLDDDPAVRLEVETRSPDVHVVPLPADPSEYCETLARLWLFDGLKPTAVDAARTQMAHEERRRVTERQAMASLAEYLDRLELQATITPPLADEWSRVAQLTHRTNQFNLSLKRRTAEELRYLSDAGIVLALRARDRFGDYGLVGVCVASPTQKSSSAAWEIDTLLMSCRALGRGLEDVFLHVIGTEVARRGAGELGAPFVPGSRNGQVKDFLAGGGFIEASPDHWIRSLDELPPLPKHVQLLGGTSTSADRRPVDLPSASASCGAGHHDM